MVSRPHVDTYIEQLRCIFWDVRPLNRFSALNLAEREMRNFSFEEIHKYAQARCICG